MSSGSVNVINALLGAPLRVGTIPSINACPNFNNSALRSMDGGLVTPNPNSGPATVAYSVSNLFYWIGPNGDYLTSGSDSNFSRYASDVYAEPGNGGFYDPVFSVWYGIPNSNALFPGKDYVSQFRINNNNKSFYSNFLPGYGGFFTDPLIAAGYFAKEHIYPYGGIYFGNGFSTNFTYGGIDQVICITFPNPSCNSLSPMEISYPYGVTGMDFMGAPYITNNNNCPVAPNLSSYFSVMQSVYNGPNYRVGTDRPVIFLGNLSTNKSIIIATNSGGGLYANWIVVKFGLVPNYVGRLWDGFVFTNAFTNYGGCVYTEDCITFRPLIDITDNLNFSESVYFGLNGNINSFFMNGFGFSYLANYRRGTSPFTQAAFKIMLAGKITKTPHDPATHVKNMTLNGYLNWRR